MYHSKGQHQFWNGRDRMDVKRFRKYTNVQRDEILEKAGLTEREEAALAQERAERFTEQQTAQSQREMYTLFREEDDRIKQVVKDTTGALIETGNALAKLNEVAGILFDASDVEKLYQEIVGVKGGL